MTTPCGVYQAVARRLSTKPKALFASPSYGIGDLIRDLIDDKLEQAREQIRQQGGDDPEGQAHRSLARWLKRTVGRAWCESHSYRQAIVRLGLAYLEGDDRLERSLEAWLLAESVPQGELRDAGGL